MTTQYNKNYVDTMPFSDTVFQAHLATSSNQAYTVPGTDLMVYQALFSYNDTANVYVALNAVPVVPVSGANGSQQYNEFRPQKRYVRGGDTINFMSPDATGAHVGVSLRQLQG